MGRKRREEREIQEDIRKGKEKIRIGEKAVIEALQRLYQISEAEAKEYSDLVWEEPDLDLSMYAEEAFENIDDRYNTRLNHLEKSAVEYEQWLAKLIASPVALKTFEVPLDKGKVINILKDILGQEATDDMLPGTIPGYFDLMEATMDIVHTLDTFGKNGLQHVHAFAVSAREVLQKGGKEAAKLYVDDFVEEFRKETKEPTMPLAPTEVLESMEWEEIEGIVFGYVSDAFLVDADTVRDVLGRMDKAKGFYLALAGRYEISILNFLRHNGMAGPYLVSFAAERIEKLKASSSDLRIVSQLVSGAEQSQRIELLGYLCGRPEAIGLYKTLLKAQVSSEEYDEFLLTTGGLTWSLAEGKSLIDIVQKIAAVPSQAKAAAYILRNGPDILIDPEAEKLLDIAAHYPQADLVLGDYLAAAASSEKNKAKALLIIGEYKPPAEELKTLRQKLKELNDSELAWMSDPISQEQLAGRILKTESSRAVSETIPLRKKRAGWHDVMMQELEKSGARPELISLVREAYNSLGPSSSRRLRDIWTGQKESLEDFCRDVAGLGGTKAYGLILQDYSLFEAYKSRINDAGFRSRLHETAQVGNRNAYRDVGRLLKGDAYHPLPAIEEISEAEPMAGERPTYKRIIVWGGQYGHDMVEKIMHAVDTPVEVFDEFKRRKDMSGIGQEDVVVCVTSSGISHPIYYQLKRHCRKNDITFYHFGLKGHTTLVEFLQGKFGRDAA